MRTRLGGPRRAPLLLLSLASLALPRASSAQSLDGASTDAAPPSSPAVSAAPAAPEAPASQAPASEAPADPQGFNADLFASGPPASGASGEDPSVRLQIFGDAGFVARTARDVWMLEPSTAGGQSARGMEVPWNTFHAAHVDLFLTSSVGRLDFLAETLLEADMEDNEFRIDVERVQVSYLVSNALRVKLGRVHQAFGYYNDTYHHGSIFELTTGRPFLVQFEDMGGVIGPHLVGAMIDGTFSLGGAGDLRYDLEVGNGHLPDITAIANAGAASNFKRVNLRVRWMPRFLDGLIVGVNGALDEVPAMGDSGHGVNMRPNALGELIGGVHLVYMEHHAHVLVEGAVVRHTDRGTGDVYETAGGFAELGYAFGDWTPYVRWESLRLSRGDDPAWATTVFGMRGARDVRDARVGVNWHPNEHLALKLEARWLDVDGAVDTQQASGQFQLAFGF